MYRRRAAPRRVTVGSSFFKGKGAHGPSIDGGNQGLEARAIGSGAYGARGAAMSAQKSLGAALAVNKAAVASHGPLKRSAAYPKGPKL
jgi:hypothetical protein